MWSMWSISLNLGSAASSTQGVFQHPAADGSLLMRFTTDWYQASDKTAMAQELTGLWLQGRAYATHCNRDFLSLCTALIKNVIMVSIMADRANPADVRKAIESVPSAFVQGHKLLRSSLWHGLRCGAVWALPHARPTLQIVA